MAEIFGAVAAGLTICTQLAQLGNAIRKGVKRIKNARKDVLELSDEAVLFAGLCEDFLRTCDDHREPKSKAFTSLDRLVAWLEQPESALSELLEKVKALIRDPKYQYSWQEKCIAQIEWFGSKGAVKRLRASLSIARSSISGYSNLMCIQKLNEELRMLHLATRCDENRRIVQAQLGMTLEKKIDIVERAINIKSTVHDTNKRMLKEARDETTQQRQGERTLDLNHIPEDLLQFTESLGAYAKEVLPPVRPSRRSLPSQKSNSASGSVVTPGRWRRQDPPSTSSSNQVHISREIESRPGLATSSSVSTSASSHSSREQIIAAPDTISSVSSTRQEVVKSKTPSGRANERTRVKRGGRTFLGFPETKSREYINDPEGNILSHPKVKHHGPASHVPKTQQMGRHEMELSATHFRINDHSYSIPDYHVGEAFFRTLLQHPDRFDELVEILDTEDKAEEWGGIPGWVVGPRQILKQPETLV